MFRKFIVITKYLCFAALAAAALFIGVSAGGLTLALPDGSIALNCSIERDGQMMYLAGDTYALSKIADLSIESGSKIRYRISEAFAAYECDWASLSDSERAKAAKLMAEDAKEHRLYCAQVETDAYGRGCFDCLAPGLYLISRIKAAQENDCLLYTSRCV